MPKPNLKALGIQPKGRSISKKDFNVMKKIFINYDKDNSGTVTYKEFVKAISDKKDLVRSAAGMFQEMDVNGDGEMTFKELLRAFYPACSEEDIDATMEKYTKKPVVVVIPVKELTEEQKEEIAMVCRMWDKDKDGTVSKSELRDQCQNLGIEEATINDWFKKYDADGNEELTIDEVQELMKEVWEE